MNEQTRLPYRQSGNQIPTYAGSGHGLCSYLSLCYGCAIPHVALDESLPVRGLLCDHLCSAGLGLVWIRTWVLRGFMILCESDPTVVECVCACLSACVSVCAHARAHFPSWRIHSFHQILKGIYDLSRFRTNNQTPSAVGSMITYD